LYNLCDVLKALGKLQEAETVARDALALRRKLYGEQDARVLRLVDTLVRLLRKRGDLAEAESVLRETVKRQREASDDPQPPVAATLAKLAYFLRQAGKHDEAEAAFRELLDLQISREGRESEAAAGAMTSLAMQLASRKPLEAETLARDALVIQERLHGHDDFRVVEALHHLAEALAAQGKAAKAEQAWREGIAIDARLKQMGRHQSYSTYWMPFLLGRLLDKQGRSADAEAVFRLAVAEWQKAPSVANRYMINSVVGLAEALQGQGKHAEAEVLYREELTRSERVLGSQAPEVAKMRLNLGKLLRAQGRLQEAAVIFREGAEHAAPNTLNGFAWPMATSPNVNERNGSIAVELAEKAVAATARTNYLIMDTLAAAYAEAGQFTNAVRVQKEAIALIPATQMSLREDFASRLRLFESNAPYREYGREATRLQTEGKLAKAETLLHEQLSMRRAMFAADHPSLANALASLAHVMVEEGKFSEVEPLARECLDIREAKLPDSWLTFNVRSLLGGALLGRKKYADAEPFLRDGYEGMKQREKTIPASARSIRLKESLERIVQLYEAWNKPEQAAEWKQKLAESDKAK